MCVSVCVCLRVGVCVCVCVFVCVVLGLGFSVRLCLSAFLFVSLVLLSIVFFACMAIVNHVFRHCASLALFDTRTGLLGSDHAPDGSADHDEQVGAGQV
jgi:hypothetical protein